MEIGKRLKYLREAKNMTQAAFGAKVGKKQQEVSAWEKGDTRIRADEIPAIAEALDVRPSAFYKDEGTLYPLTKAELDDTVSIPLVDIEASAGPGAFADDETVTDYLQIPRRLLELQGIKHTHLAYIRVQGDSMMPAIAPGDLVLVELRAKRLRDNGVYVFRQDDMIRIKRIFILMTGKIKLQSDNWPEEAEELTADEMDQVVIVGRVVSLTKHSF